LIVDVSWNPKGDLAFEVQDREQSWLDLNLVPAGAATVAMSLFRETTKTWVNVHGSPKWLGDGSFLWFSERSGWKHIYRTTDAGSSSAR